MDDKLYNDSVNILGFKSFLDKFIRGDIIDRFEADSWNTYIIFSYLFNLSTEVINKLEKIYPFAFHRFSIDIKDSLFVDDFVNNIIKGIRK